MDLHALAVAAGLAWWTPPVVAVPKSAPPSRPAAAAAAQELPVVLSPSGAVAPWNAALDALLSARVIAVGEKHDEASHHQVQARVLAALARRDPGLVVGLEMVSQDLQGPLDDFMSGKTSEADFSAWWKKTWGFDFALYKPVFDAARAAKVRVVGLNAPISVVIAVARKGLAGLTPEQRARLPARVEESADPRYRRFVLDSLEGHKLPPDAMARMIEAQAAWNETMGAKAAELAQKSRVLVIAGQGHVFWRAGILESAARRGAAPGAAVLPYPLDGGTMSVPDQLKRLRDAESGELAMGDQFVLIP